MREPCENRLCGLTEAAHSVKIELLNVAVRGKMPAGGDRVKPEDRRGDPFGEAEDVASCTECTGLMPALPPDDAAQVESAALCGIHDAKRSRKRQFRRK